MRDTALVGAGYWGRNLGRVLAELGRLSLVCDPSAEAAGVAERLGVPLVPALDDVLQRDAIRAVVIATPAATHFELARQALVAERDVFVEKPLALSTDHARELCQLAEQRRRVLMVGHLLQYHPAYRKLSELTKDGELGTLQYVYAHRLNFGRIRTEENILWSFAPHDLSMILGLAESMPVRIEANGHCYLSGDVADVTTTHLEFASGLVAHVFVSWLHPDKEQRLVVVGDRGMAIFDDMRSTAEKLVVYPHSVRWEGSEPKTVKGEPKPVPLAATEPLRAEMEHFFARVQDRGTPLTDGREGLRVVQLLNAAQARLDAETAVRALDPSEGPNRGRGSDI